VIGKRVGEEAEKGRGGREEASPSLPSAHLFNRSPRARQGGFSLLELMIVISILVILAMVAMGMYSKTVLAAKEATLRQDLHTMNRMLDQYAADKGKLPQSLEDLTGAGYLPDIPIDPITDQKDWVLEYGDDPGATDSSQGVVRVRSAATDVSSDGSSRYSDW
jgi:general secretion pathway protein G